MKKISILVSVMTALFLIATPAFAHVVVKPAEVGIAARQNFAVSVPTEEDNPTVSVRLVLPDGLKSVRPNVKPGWNIEIVKAGEGENARVSEIIWSGASIPVDQRDEFVFSAQAPAQATSLVWKAYQTYENGDVVSWDQDPKQVEEYAKNHPVKDGEDDDSGPKPYSVTNVTNDLTGTSVQLPVGETAGLVAKVNFLMLLSGAALILSVAALYLQMKKK